MLIIVSARDAIERKERIEQSTSFRLVAFFIDFMAKCAGLSIEYIFSS